MYRTGRWALQMGGGEGQRCCVSWAAEVPRRRTEDRDLDALLGEVALGLGEEDGGVVRRRVPVEEERDLVGGHVEDWAVCVRMLGRGLVGGK